MAFAGHVLRGSSSDSALTLMEGKMDGKSARTTQGMWMSKKTKLDNYEKIKRADRSGGP